MQSEDRLTTIEKRLRYHQVVAGILAFCLILAVATHLDAQPRQRGRNQAVSQPIDSRRLNVIMSQILDGIEQRLSALEKTGISQKPAAPAMHQTGSSSDLVAIETRLTALENQAVSQQPATSNQAGSTPGELTCTKLRVVNSAGQPLIVLDEAINGTGQARFNKADGTILIGMGKEIFGTYLTMYRGGQPGITFYAQAGGFQSSSAIFIMVTPDPWSRSTGRISVFGVNSLGENPPRPVDLPP